MFDNLTISEVHIHLAPEKLQDTLDMFVNQLRKIIMDQATHAAALAAVKDQIERNRAEVAAKIAALAAALAKGVTTPEVDAALAALQAVSQAADDDVVPDVAP